MKKHLPWIIALPLFCMPVNTAFAIHEATAEPSRVVLGVQKKHKHGSKHYKKKSQQVQEKCLGAPKSTYNNPFYYVKCVGADGETLITTDETVWQIAPSSTNIILGWPENSTITISPSKWYSKYDYYLTNSATQECACAKLSQGPFLQYAIFVSQIYHYTHSLTLSNGTVWLIAGDPNFDSWQVGQAVLLGVNDTWFGRPNMIININENNYVTATRIF
jgi:hypothetical protein